MKVGALVGSNLRSLRLERKMTLKDVSSLTGLSCGYLSLLERGHALIALDTLEHISDCFNIDISHFFICNTASSSPVIYRRCNQIYQQVDSHRFETILTHFAESSIVPSVQTVMPISSKGELPPFTSRNGELFIYVLDGILTLDFGQEVSQIFPGDSAHFLTHQKYRYYNTVHFPAKIFVATLDSDKKLATDQGESL